MARSRLDLLVPALFAALPWPPSEAPRAPSLERMLGRGDRVTAAGADPVSTLFGRFGISAGPEQDLPSAPFSLLADSPETDLAGFWLHADPVHLRADQDRLRLFDSRPLGIGREEADALVALFNTHFRAEGLMLEAPEPGRWYLQVAGRRGIKTQPLHAAVGRSVGSLLPRGPDAGWWNPLLNEVQMLFHQAEVNRRREELGSPLVNGIWVWGGGCLEQTGLRTDLAAVYADHPLARGLAMAAGADLHPLPTEGIGDAAEAGHRLVFWDSLWPPALDQDVVTWERELGRLDAWSGTLLSALGRRAVAEIYIHPCDGSSFRVTPAAMRRLWRRSLPLFAYRSV
ncbi:MAG: phosphoglycerate mutase [Chromatiaceae bacterium]